MQRRRCCYGVQNESFHNELNKSISSLLPFKDAKGLTGIKTNNKLFYRIDNIDFKNPILLPAKRPVVLMLIRKHEDNFCVGSQG